MDALDLLTADHNRVRGLFTRFKSAKESDDTARMGELAATLFTELEVHTTIEEEIFYPWVKGLSTEESELVDEGVEEHHVVKTLMGEIDQLEPGDKEWVAKLSVLIENVEHHAEEEEKEMWPGVRSATTAATRDGIAQQLEARKKELGAPTLEDKIDLTTEALKTLATEQEIPGRSSMDHDELAATVSPS